MPKKLPTPKPLPARTRSSPAEPQLPRPLPRPTLPSPYDSFGGSDPWQVELAAIIGLGFVFGSALLLAWWFIHLPA